MTLKEAGESYEALPGLSRTMPLALFREARWCPYWRMGLIKFVRRGGHALWILFQTSYDMVSGPGAAELEYLARAVAISSRLTGK